MIFLTAASILQTIYCEEEMFAYDKKPVLNVMPNRMDCFAVQIEINDFLLKYKNIFKLLTAL